LPKALSVVHPKLKTPHWALFAGGLVGIIAIVSGSTDKLIILSVLGAVVMYIVSMISLFVLRKNQPDMERPFKVPFYPLFPFVALLLSIICLLAIVYYNLILSLVFFATMAVAAILFKLFYKEPVQPEALLLNKNG
jgi:ethanolamine permease